MNTHSHSYSYFPIFNNRLHRKSEDAETATQRNMLEEMALGPLLIGLALNVSSDLIKDIEKQINPMAEKSKALLDKTEKSKAEHFPCSLLKIGGYEVKSTHAADLVAKCYYRKRKLVWEILRDGLKKKIEIPWHDILSLQAILEENRSGVLMLELSQPPMFFYEVDPMPKQHTVWRPMKDFTGGHASTYRIHYVEFPPGVLEQHYEKMISDSQLLQLTQKPFPSLNRRFFYPNNAYGNDEQHKPFPFSQFICMHSWNVSSSGNFNGNVLSWPNSNSGMVSQQSTTLVNGSSNNANVNEEYEVPVKSISGMIGQQSETRFNASGLLRLYELMGENYP